MAAVVLARCMSDWRWQDANPATIYRRLVRKYGLDRTDALLQRLASIEKMGPIAVDYGVSPQRVHQWRFCLTTCTTRFEVYPEIAEIAHEQGEE